MSGTTSLLTSTPRSSRAQGRVSVPATIIRTRSRDRKVTTALRAYAAMATSADKGAVRDISKLG